jgi:hypothetical protein
VYPACPVSVLVGLQRFEFLGIKEKFKEFSKYNCRIMIMEAAYSNLKFEEAQSKTRMLHRFFLLLFYVKCGKLGIYFEKLCNLFDPVWC